MKSQLNPEQVKEAEKSMRGQGGAEQQQQVQAMKAQQMQQVSTWGVYCDDFQRATYIGLLRLEERASCSRSEPL